MFIAICHEVGLRRNKKVNGHTIDPQTKTKRKRTYYRPSQQETRKQTYYRPSTKQKSESGPLDIRKTLKHPASFVQIRADGAELWPFE